MRGLTDTVWPDPADAKAGSQLLGIEEKEHVIGSFAGIEIPGNGIDVRENQIHRFLREVVEGFAAGNDVPEKRMVLLDMRLLG